MTDLQSRLQSPKPRIKRWDRCTWLLVIGIILAAVTMGLFVPGVIGLSNGTTWYGTLLWFSVVVVLFAGIFFIFWWMCQYEIVDIEKYQRILPQNKSKKSVRNRLDPNLISVSYYRKKSNKDGDQSPLVEQEETFGLYGNESEIIIISPRPGTIL